MDDLGVPLFSETSMFFWLFWGRGFNKPPKFNSWNLKNNPLEKGKHQSIHQLLGSNR